MNTMMLLLLTTTFYFDWLACIHHCKSLEVQVAKAINKYESFQTIIVYVWSSQRSRVAVPGKP